MSRIGKNPISIPNGVTVEITGQQVVVKGPKGQLSREIHSAIKVEMQDNQVIATRKDESKESKSLHGLSRTLIANMLQGVSKGFEKRLEIIGVGYRANPAKNRISLTLGYSHPVEYIAPNDIEFKMDEDAKNIIIIQGIDKQTVGEVAAKIRSYRMPEPYKGKGIRYFGEKVRRKAGKTAAAK